MCSRSSHCRCEDRDSDAASYRVLGYETKGMKFLNFENPLAPREYTGDAYMLQVTATKRDGKVKFSKVDPILVTNYMDRDNNMTIRRFTEDFIADLPTEKERSYYKRRLSAMKDIHP